MQFILLINVKMPTFVGILTFISWINTASESFKARNFFIFQHFGFYQQLKFHAQWRSSDEHENCFITSRPVHEIRDLLQMCKIIF